VSAALVLVGLAREGRRPVRGRGRRPLEHVVDGDGASYRRSRRRAGDARGLVAVTTAHATRAWPLGRHVRLVGLLRGVTLPQWGETVEAAGWTLARVLLSTALGTLWAVPAGLAIDTKNHILFAMCRGGRSGKPTCVILSAVDGKIITTLPLAGSSDGAVFNPRTMEAFSSHGNGTLSVIKENSPTEFVLEETVKTKAGAKTCTLDTKTDHVIVITREADPEGGRKQLLDVMFTGR